MAKKDKKEDRRSNVVRTGREIKPAQDCRPNSRSVDKVQAKTTTTAFTKKKGEEGRLMQPTRTVSNSFERKKNL